MQNMLIPINLHPRAPHNLESRARTISTRNAGGAEPAEMSRVRANRLRRAEPER